MEDWGKVIFEGLIPIPDQAMREAIHMAKDWEKNSFYVLSIY